MEGGTDQDLRLLDVVTSSHDDNTSKQSSEKIDNETDSKKSPDNKVIEINSFQTN